MAEIKRKRTTRYVNVGLPSPMQVEDRATQTNLQAVHATLFDLQRQIDEIKSTSTEVDDTLQDPIMPRMPETGIDPNLSGWKPYIVATFAGLQNIRNIKEGDQAYVQQTLQWFGYRRVSTTWSDNWTALQQWVATNETALDTLDATYGVKDGDTGYALSEDTVWYWGNAQWNAFGTGTQTFYTATTYANLTALIASEGLTEGAKGRTTGNGQRYQLEDESATLVWRVDGCFRMTTAPSSIGERAGDYWYDSDDHKGYRRVNTTWKPDTFYPVWT